MSHPTTDALIELHFGEASPEVREFLTRHVAACAACGAFVAELTRVERELAAGPDEAPPRDGLERVLARVAAVEPVRRRRAEWLAALLPSGAALAAGAWAVRTGGERLATLGLLPASTLGPLSAETLGVSLAALGLVAVGAVVTLALAPVLILESHGRS